MNDIDLLNGLRIWSKVLCWSVLLENFTTLYFYSLDEVFKWRLSEIFHWRSFGITMTMFHHGRTAIIGLKVRLFQTRPSSNACLQHHFKCVLDMQTFHRVGSYFTEKLRKSIDRNFRT